MESTHHVTVPLRAGKKMKKRKELDALVAHSGPGKRVGGGGGGGGSSPQDQLLSESTDEHDDYWSGKDRGGGGSNGGGGGTRCRLFYRRRLFGSLLRACTAVLVFTCVVATTTVMWLFIDIREQVTSLRNELDQGAVSCMASCTRSCSFCIFTLPTISVLRYLNLCTRSCSQCTSSLSFCMSVTLFPQDSF
jgi:hypothetical protein